MKIAYWAPSLLGLVALVGFLGKIFLGDITIAGLDHRLFDDEDTEQYEDQAEAKWREL